ILPDRHCYLRWAGGGNCVRNSDFTANFDVSYQLPGEFSARPRTRLSWAPAALSTSACSVASEGAGWGGRPPVGAGRHASSWPHRNGVVTGTHPLHTPRPGFLIWHIMRQILPEKS